MQNQNSTSLNTEAATTGPVEINAEDLHQVGGGAPKGTWSPAASSLGDFTNAPKGTW